MICCKPLRLAGVSFSSPKEQLWEDGLPLIAFDAASELFLAVAFAPAQDRAHLSAQETSPVRWRPAFGHTTERATLAIFYQSCVFFSH